MLCGFVLSPCGCRPAAMYQHEESELGRGGTVQVDVQSPQGGLRAAAADNLNYYYRSSGCMWWTCHEHDYDLYGTWETQLVALGLYVIPIAIVIAGRLCIYRIWSPVQWVRHPYKWLRFQFHEQLDRPTTSVRGVHLHVGSPLWVRYILPYWSICGCKRPEYFFQAP